MNIFVLDANPAKCAQYHFDRHVSKMITEHVQLLSTVNRLLGIDSGYQMISNPNIGLVRWLLESQDNILWTRDLTEELNKEYKYRYQKSVNQSSYTRMTLMQVPPLDKFNTKGMTVPYMAMPFGYRQPDPIRAYRNYYKGEKRRLAVWTGREVPEWWNEYDSPLNRRRSED